ncbi:uncharacterized protein [Oscarella lobularis]|uniref:uncharacterized protein n=1 Tax=Oscarella lobularis TaxID=121494 RepID=UPI003313D122
MASLGIAERCDLIDQIELPPVEHHTAPDEREVRYSEGDTEGKVIGGSVMRQEKSLSPQQQTDVAYSTLLAQLAADSKDKGHSVEWYREYMRVMSLIGWRSEKLDFSEIHGKLGQKLSEIILNLLSSILSAEQIKDLEIILNSLKDPQNVESNFLFNKKAASGTNATFQISDAYIGTRGGAAMHFLASQFNGKREILDVLGIKFDSSSMSMYMSVSQFELNEDIYGGVREQVRAKLGDRAKTEIKGIQI